MLARIRDVDLFAAEAHYHPSCRKAYTRAAGLGRSMNIDVRNNQLDLEKTHQKAFESICNTVSSQVIGKKQIIRLDDLREEYIRELNQTSYPNPNYRAEKLKAKLEKHDCIGEEIGIASVMDNTLSSSQGKCTSQIIFCKSMDIEGAIKLAYILGNIDSFKKVAGLLKQSILDAFQNSEKIPWPPTAEYLKQLDGIVPNMLQRFLKMACQVARLNRIGLSVGQDIYRAETNGRWKMPKSMTLRHVSKQGKVR